MADYPGIIELDPEGDVQLQLSPGREQHENATTLIVASKTLTLASPVFDRMLNSSFKEGIAKTAEGKVTIPLPDDDPEAMIIVCRALHHMNHLVPEQLTSTSLEKIAVLCNKYDCMRALAAHGNVWVRNGLERLPSRSSLDRLLYAAYVLDMPAAFAKVAWDLVLGCAGRIVDLGVEIPALFPAQILEKLEHLREELQQKLTDALELPLADILTYSPCPGIARLAGLYIAKLKNANLWPLGPVLRKASLSMVLERIQVFQEPGPPQCPNYCQRCTTLREIKFKNELCKKREEVLNARTKLCLDCLKSADQTLKEGKCRIKHT